MKKTKEIIKKNKNIIVGMLILILLIGVGVAVSFAYFNSQTIRNIFTGEADYFANPDLNIKYMKENRDVSGAGNGTYTAYWDAPLIGYTYNESKSSCSNGATFTRNEADETFNITMKGKTNCSFYYDASGEAITADTTLTIMKQKGTSSEYELANDYLIQTLLNGGYSLNESKSTCEHGEITVDNQNKTLITTASQVSSCTAYFDLGTSQYEYTGDYQKFIALESGTYKFETWGASGRDISDYDSGSGGYASGNIYLNRGDIFYVYVGKQGVTSNAATQMSFNGGGSLTEGSADFNAGSGGGATDIRLISGNWNNTNGLNSRVMVAGGSGGLAVTGNDSSYGHGGGLVGYDAISNYLGGHNADGSTQTYGFSFGEGQSNSRAGGGGGYYGGYANDLKASGGSSFISGHTGAVAIASESDRTPKSIDFDVRYIEIGSNGNSVNDDNHIVEVQAFDVNGINVALNKSMTNIIGTSTPGISNVTDGDSDSERYSNYTSPATLDLGAEYNLTSIKLWRAWADGRYYNESYVKVYNADKTKSEYIHNYLYDGTYVETSEGKTMTLTCTTGTTNNSCSHHYSGYVFGDTVMIDGAGYNWTNEKGSQVAMPNPAGGTYTLGTGHTGNGYAKITYVGK